MNLTELIILLWIPCSILSVGINYAYFQNKYKLVAKRERINDYMSAIYCSFLGGTGGLIFIVFFSGFCKYGFRIIPYPKDHEIYRDS